MTQKKTGYLELGDGALYYEIAGQGTPLVLNHAAFLDSRMFDAQFDVFAQDYQVIRYDMHGFGQSSAAEAPICRREDLRLLLDHLEVDQAHFVGCSNGGSIMLDLALEQPERVLSLTLVGSTPNGFELVGEPPRYIMEMMDAMQRGDIERSNELQIRIWFDGSDREPDEVDSTLREKALAMNRIPVERQTFAIADMQPVCPLDPPAVNRLSEIQCPTLVTTGSLDHAEVVRAVDVMGDQIRGARKFIFEGAAHVPSFEQPEAFNRVLREFLGR